MVREALRPGARRGRPASRGSLKSQASPPNSGSNPVVAVRSIAASVAAERSTAAMPFCHQPVIAWPCTGEDCFIAAEDPGNWILAEAPAAYRPRHPERAGFYQLFETHFDSYVRAYEERFEARSGPLRPVVVRSVEAFLTAGGCKEVSPGFAVRSAMTSTFWRSPAEQEISVRVARPGAPCSLPKNSPQKF